MLRVDLGQLEREGSVDVEAMLPADDGLWVDSDLEWSGDVEVRLQVALSGTGEIVARGTARGALAQECRRCLKPVVTNFATFLTMVFVSTQAGEDDDGTMYVFEPKGSELDLSSAVREEVLLAVNPFVECKPECRGLCPRCGANLNEAPCECGQDEVDPRWAALRKLKSE